MNYDNSQTDSASEGGIDYSKYTPASKLDSKRKRWTPPFSEQVMQDSSNKLALSTRCYPEYLLAAYAFLTEKRGVTEISSLSNLLYTIVCDYLNQNLSEIGRFPDAETALDWLLMQEWITPDNRENLAPMSKIRSKQIKLQERIDSGHATDSERYEYWKTRDPEKAEAILQEMTSQAWEQYFGDDDDEQADTQPPVEDNSPVIEPKGFDSLLEQATKKQQDGIAGLDNMPTETVNEDSDTD